MDKPQTAADRKVRLQKLRRTSLRKVDMTPLGSKPTRGYWKSVFKEVEATANVPYHKRYAVLLQVTKSKELVERLSEIYHVYAAPEDVESCPSTSIQKSFTENIIPVEFKFPEEDVSSSSKSLADFKSVSFVNVKSERRNYRNELLGEGYDDRRGGNVYAKFLRKSPSRAARWRTKPTVEFHGNSLTARSDAITKQIASDFCEWMRGLGGTTTLDEAAIEALFEMHFSNDATDSLKIEMQELNAVTDAVAEAQHLPEAAFSKQLLRQLTRDMTIVRSKEQNFAFGTMLPPEMRSGTKHDLSVIKWMENKRVPERISTMAIVWEGIEHTKVTQHYCKWLLEQPRETQLPEYLVKKGLFSAHPGSLKPTSSVTFDTHRTKSFRDMSKSTSQMLRG